MRLVQATVPSGRESAVRDALDEQELNYFVTEEVGNEAYAELVYVSIPDQEVEETLECLYRAGLDEDDHVMIVDVEADIFGRTGAQGDGLGEHARIAAAELEGKTDDLLPDRHTFLTMMVLATIVATAGLLLDSAAVVVGSMVLAPLFGPAVSTSVGTVIDDAELFRRGVEFQVLGVATALVSATAFAWVVRTTYLVPAGVAITNTPQIVERLSPDVLSLIVAFAAGVAGVLSIATGAAMALVGVMIAAALLPPAATVGIGVVWGEPLVAAHSAMLLVVNVLAINFAGLVTLWYLGYRPQSWVRIPGTRRELAKRGGVLLLALLVSSAFLLNVSYANVEQSRLRDAITEDVEGLLDDQAYANVSLVDVKIVQTRLTLTHETERVIVTVGRPPGERHPALYRKIVEQVQDRVGDDVAVDVRVDLVIPGEGAGTSDDTFPGNPARDPGFAAALGDSIPPEGTVVP